MFLVYKNIYPEPRNWYDHYLHLANSLIQKRVDVPTLPEFYHDKITLKDPNSNETKTYLPFPPGASFILIPFLLLTNNFTQQQVSIIIGSITVGLVYILLRKFTNRLNAALLSVFFGLGTVFFWSSVVGTTWFFAHVVANFYLVISLIIIFNFKNRFLLFLAGVFFALAGLTRYPILFSGLFFVFFLWKERVGLIFFLIGASIFIPLQLGYDYFRFGTLLENGYKEVYEWYTNLNYAYSIQRTLFPTLPQFNYFDIRAIPYHLYTFIIMPPQRSFIPSPYGMGIVFTSPLLLISLIPDIKSKLIKTIHFSIIPTVVLVFCHYAQGWVQFGYRFVLDFLIFLMIVLAIKFKSNVVNILLILISIAVNFWGVSWAIKLGW